MDMEFAEAYAAREAKFQRKLLDAQWHGGKVQFGQPGTPAAFVRTYPGMRKIATVIPMHWAEGEPKNGDVSTVRCIVAGNIKEWVIEPEQDRVDGARNARRLAKDYKGLAEKWALWKWHTARGTPCDDRGKYLLEPDYKAPSYDWTWNGKEPEPEAA